MEVFSILQIILNVSHVTGHIGDVIFLFCFDYCLKA